MNIKKLLKLIKVDACTQSWLNSWINQARELEGLKNKLHVNLEKTKD